MSDPSTTNTTAPDEMLEIDGDYTDQPPEDHVLLYHDQEIEALKTK